MTTRVDPPETPDPFIDEARALKRDASERFGNDPARIAEHLRAIERARPDNVVEPPRDRATPPGKVA